MIQQNMARAKAEERKQKPETNKETVLCAANGNGYLNQPELQRRRCTCPFPLSPLPGLILHLPLSLGDTIVL